MTAFRPLFGLCVLAILSGCSFDEEATVVEVLNGVEFVTNLGELDSLRFPLTFELDRTFGVEEEPFDQSIASVRSLEVDRNGNLYILDSRNSRLMAFDSSGAHLWNAGSNGSGPGEIMAPRSIALFGDMVYVANQRGTRIDTWSTTSGEYAGTVPFPDKVAAGATLEGIASRRMIFSSGTPKSVASTLWFANVETHELLDSMTFKQEIEQQIPGQISQLMNVDVSANGIRIAGATNEYLFWMLDSSGRMERKVEWSVHHLWGPTVMGNLFVPYVGIRKMMSLSNGATLVYVMVPKTDPAVSTQRRMAGEASASSGSLTTLDFFDSDGSYQGSMIKDDGYLDIGTPQIVGPDGSLYTTVSTPFVAVRRYRVHWN